MNIRILFLSVLMYYSCSAQDLYKTSWEKDGVFFASGTILSITGLFLENNIDPLTIDEISGLSRENIHRLDRGATYNWSENISDFSDWLVAATIASPLTLFFSKDIRKDYKAVSIMYLETLLLTSGIRSVTKGLIERNRPYVYNPEAPIDEKLDIDAKRSFFSGHTATAFATTFFFASVYEDYNPESRYSPCIWGGAILVSSFVGYCRYNAGKHYPSDILTGAIIGSAIGILVPYIHKNENDENSINLTSAWRPNPQISIGFSF